MNTVQALNTLIAVMQSIAVLQQQANAMAALIGKVHADGRSDLTPDEWAAVIAADDAAKDLLQKALVP